MRPRKLTCWKWLALLEPLLAAHPGPEGDTYTLERDKTGRHGRIMKYNLNKAS